MLRRLEDVAAFRSLEEMAVLRSWWAYQQLLDPYFFLRVGKGMAMLPCCWACRMLPASVAADMASVVLGHKGREGLGTVPLEACQHSLDDLKSFSRNCRRRVANSLCRWTY